MREHSSGRPAAPWTQPPGIKTHRLSSGEGVDENTARDTRKTCVRSAGDRGLHKTIGKVRDVAMETGKEGAFRDSWAAETACQIIFFKVITGMCTVADGVCVCVCVCLEIVC